MLTESFRKSSWRCVLLPIILYGSISAAQRSPLDGSAPLFSESDLRRFVDNHLAENTDARTLLEFVYELYVESHAEAWVDIARRLDRARELLQASREQGDPAVGFWTSNGDDFGRGKALLDWEAASLDLLSQFEANATAVMPDEHAESWADFMRSFHRRRWRDRIDPYKAFPWLDDLSETLLAVEPTPEEVQGVAALLDDYLVEYECALRHAAESMPDLRRRQFDIESRRARGMRAADEDDRALNLEWRALIEPIEQVNQRYFGRIKEALPPDAVERFNRSVTARLLPQMYKASVVDRVVELLMDSPSLPRDLLRDINAVYTHYVAERERLRAGLIRACYEWTAPRRLNERAEAFSELRRLQREGHRVDLDQARVGHPGMRFLRELLALEDRTCSALLNLLRAANRADVPQEVRFLLEWAEIGGN